MSIPTPSAELLDSVELGDRAATTEFVERYGAAALQLVRLWFSRLSHEDCEEIAQDIMMDVLASVANYDRSKPFKPWFVTIVRRRALDFTEKHAKEWVEGERGLIPTHVSFEEATEPDAPRSLKNQVLAATSRELLGDGQTASEMGVPDAISASAGAKLVALKQWVSTLDEPDRVLLDHHLYGASWDEVAAKLATFGHTVTAAAARVRGHRLIARAKRELTGQPVVADG